MKTGRASSISRANPSLRVNPVASKTALFTFATARGPFLKLIIILNQIQFILDNQ